MGTHYNASNELRHNREIVLAAVTQNGYSLQYASNELQNDREIVLAAVTQDGYALHYASNELRNNREVVLAAVAQNGYALHYASNELRNDRDVVLTAVTQNYEILQYISQILQNDVDFVLKVVKIHSGIDITPYIQHFKVFNSPEFIGEAIYLPNIRSTKIDKCRVISTYLPSTILDLLYGLI